MKKNKLKIFIVLVLSLTNIYAQKSEATLYFRNGLVKNGYASIIKSENKIKFKHKKKSKPVKYDFRTLKKIIIEETEYEYKITKRGSKPKILKLVVRGDLSLYSIDEAIQATIPVVGVAQTVGSLSAGLTVGAGIPLGMTSSYYVSKKESSHLAHKITTKSRPKSKLFKNKKQKTVASSFFKRCQHIVNKIWFNNLKGKDMIQLVEYYNNDCNLK